MRTQNQKRYFIVLALVLVLAVQAVMMGYFGHKKIGYFVDEIYTYELANDENTFFSQTDGYLNGWVDGAFFQEAMSVDGLGDLDYATVYHNQEKDVHPPFYYAVIHTVSALFHGQVSKWIGILPNMVFCLLTTVLLYLVAARLFPNRVLALLTAALWALSVGTMTTAVFIRMYALLTCLATALVLVHLRALEDVRRGKLRKRNAALLFVTTLLGILTQYYFLVLCFFLCGIFFVYLCATRRWKLLAGYTVLEGAAVCAAVAIFPRMLFHIFGGSRGKEAFENAAVEGDFLNRIKSVFSIISSQLFNSWIKECVLLAIAVVVVYFFWRHVLHIKLSKGKPGTAMVCTMNVHLDEKLQVRVADTTLIVVALGLVAVGYCAMIAKVAPYQVDRYYMCIYPMVSLCVSYLLYQVVHLCVKNRTACALILSVIAICVTVASYRGQSVNYLYEYYQARYDALQPYQTYPVVYLTINGTHNNRADTFAMEYLHAPYVFCCEKGDYTGVEKAAASRDISQGFLLYVQDYGKMSDEEIREEIEKQVEVKQFELLTRIGCNVYFCTLEEGTT